MGSLKPENSDKQDLNDSGCVQDASVSESSYVGRAQLLDLSDDVLLYILRLCSPMDLKALGHTCPRLGSLICDRTLWQQVDARSTPVGTERLKWLLTHCLSSATTELKLAGYTNRQSRCLGIQDLTWPVENDPGSGPEVEVEHFLLRMWYPHLPRCAVSPRWPDKKETEAKAAKDAQNSQAAAAGESNDKPTTSSEANESSPKIRVQTNRTYETNLDLPVNLTSPTKESPIKSSTKRGSGNGSCRQPGINLARPVSKTFRSKGSVPSEEPEEDSAGDCKGPQFTVSGQLMRQLKAKCTQLTSLFLEYCNIDYRSTNLITFPPNLKKLSLRGTRCYNLPLNSSYLCKVQDRLQDLEFLDVSECEWFEPANLMPLSKIPGLTHLYMKDCKKLTECVAYTSLATRYGFRRLRVLDVRGSPLADSEVSALGWLPDLEELYCSPPKDVKNPSEHTHSWTDTLGPFKELEDWELEEPDYYKVNSPEPTEAMEEEEEEPKLEPEVNEPQLFGNPWWAHERRIIVIQPNVNRQAEAERPPEPPRPQEPPAQPAPSPAPQAEPGPSKRPNSDPHQLILNLVKRPRLERDDPLPDRDDCVLNPLSPVNNPEICPRLLDRIRDDIEGPSTSRPRTRSRILHIQGHNPVHLTVERERQPASGVIGYHLVTDSAILRFGRSDNDNINYIHIGRNGVNVGNDAAARPDRSNLRILSATGYSNITDRSLEHLATAAPYLTYVDVTNTGVSCGGVEVFKALRPNCEVIFGEYK